MKFRGIFPASWFPESGLSSVLRQLGVNRARSLNYVAPLAKPNKDACCRVFREPISLIYMVARLLEAVIPHRLRPAFEDRLRSDHFAYRRFRGAEFRRLQLHDCVRSVRRKKTPRELFGKNTTQKLKIT